MLNFRVEYLSELIAVLKDETATIAGEKRNMSMANLDGLWIPKAINCSFGNQ